MQIQTHLQIDMNYKIIKYEYKIFKTFFKIIV